MNAPLVTHELLSALADDQLGQDACADLLASCRLDDSALECWKIYHLIGEQLRTPGDSYKLNRTDDELAFVRKLGSRLAAEVAASSGPVLVSAPPEMPVGFLPHSKRQAANDGSFRWKLVAGVVSLAAVAAIAWNTSGLPAPSSLQQLALAPAPQIVVTSPNGPMVRDLKLEEMLAAHRQFGTATALQESSGFLRNATFETPRETLPGNGR